MFTFGLFLTCLARLPNLRVLIVSALLSIEGLQVMIRQVFALPPRDSYNTLVNFESLYGIWVLFPSVKAVITIPNPVRDLLIIFASSKVYPVAPVLEIFSEPARSTRYNLPVFDE